MGIETHTIGLIFPIPYYMETMGVDPNEQGSFHPSRLVDLVEEVQTYKVGPKSSYKWVEITPISRVVNSFEQQKQNPPMIFHWTLIGLGYIGFIVMGSIIPYTKQPTRFWTLLSWLRYRDDGARTSHVLASPWKNFPSSTSNQLSNEKNPDCLGYIGDYTTQLLVGIIISHYKDPFKPTRIQWIQWNVTYGFWSLRRPDICSC